jgi:hypothetical protein
LPLSLTSLIANSAAGPISATKDSIGPVKPKNTPIVTSSADAVPAINAEAAAAIINLFITSLPKYGFWHWLFAPKTPSSDIGYTQIDILVNWQQWRNRAQQCKDFNFEKSKRKNAQNAKKFCTFILRNQKKLIKNPASS